ncbi:MAG: dihydrolipoamide acetyltransferase family protein, partial [Ornithinimicrobium sp.]
EPASASAEEPKREANLVGYGPSAGATTRRRRKGHEQAPEDTESAEPAEAAPRPKATPPVRKYAKDRGVDLALVQPTRDDDVISRADIDAHLADAQASMPDSGPSSPASGTAQPAPSAGAGAAAQPAAPAGDTAYTPPVFDRTGPRETRTPVKGVRKMTANAMVGSAFSAPHVTEFITVDVSATMELVERLKTEREFRDLKVSPLLILAKALVVAVRRNPGVNAAWDEAAGEIVQRHYLNLGIAAATPRGLIVPNVKDADQMDLAQLAAALQDLVVTAKAGRTQPAQMSGGTITITNVGVFGVDTGTPIINPGESAIVCFGAVRRQPWVVTAADGRESIEPRWITQLAVSFDHRLVDGELGSRFLADVAALLHDPARALVWG